MPKKLTEKSDVFQRNLPVTLTDEELRHRGDALAAQLDELDRIEAKVKAAKEAAKGPKEKAEATIGELRRQLRTRSEDRLVDCEEVKRFAQRCAETIRLDTGEVVSTRPLTAQEMQTELSVIPGGKKRAASFPGDDGPEPPSKPEVPR